MATTPGRTSQLVLDSEIYALQEPALRIDLALDEIAQLTASQFSQVNENIVFIPGIGFRLLSYQQRAKIVHEQSTADGSVYNPANSNATVPTGIFSKPAQRAYTELTGVPLGIQRVSGDLKMRKGVGAGNTFAIVLSGDQASYPSPDTANDIVPMDRVFLTSGANPNHDPTIQLWFGFSSIMPATKTIGTIATILFTSIPGQTQHDYINGRTGTGGYGLKVDGDGNAYLFELLDNNTWVARHVFVWNATGSTSSIYVYATIVSDAKKLPDGSFTGTKISVNFSIQSGSLFDRVATVASYYINGPTYQNYLVPQFTVNQPVLRPARVDIRRDVTAEFWVAKSLYFPSGTFATNVVGFNQPPQDDTNPLYIEWFEDIPSGSTVAVQLYEAQSNTALATQGSSASYTYGGFKGFKIIPGKRDYYGIFTVTSSDGSVTSTINRVRFFRDRTTHQDSAVTPTIPSIVGSVSITGPDADPTHESLSAVLHDLTGELTTLNVRSGRPVRFNVFYDPTDLTKYSCLFQGYQMNASKRKRGAANRLLMGMTSDGFANNLSYGQRSIYTLKCIGEWQRLMEAQASRTIYGADLDPNTLSVGPGKPFKVTDFIKILLLDAGYNITQIDVPDMPIQFLVDNGPYVVEMFTQLGPVIIDIVRHYLGGYLIWDPNATNGGGFDDAFGCWRVKIPPKNPPWNTLAQFWSSTDGFYATQGIHPVNQFSVEVGTGSWPDTPGLGSFSGQMIKNTWMRKHSIESHVVKPEANIIYVTGVGGNPKAVTAIGNMQLTQVAINYKSAWFSPTQGTGGGPPAPDPNSPDYLGRVVAAYYSAPWLTTEGAVNLMTRRLYDMLCHGQKRIIFESPAVFVTDSQDPLQIRPRLLRFGDPVMVDGASFFVGSCNTDIAFEKGGTRFSHAAYEVFSVPGLTTNEGVPINPSVGRT